MSRTGVAHGALVRVKVGGVVVAQFFNVGVTERFNHQPVDPLGQAHVEEHILVGYEVSGRGEKYLTFEKRLESVGLVPSRTAIRDIVNHPEAVVEVESNAGQTVERLLGFRVTEADRTYQKGQLSMERFSWVARINTTEAEN